MTESRTENDEAPVTAVDYSDPAQMPHPPRPKRHRSDTGGFVSAGIVTGLILAGGFAYATYIVGGTGPLHQQALHALDGSSRIQTSPGSSIGN